MTNTMENVNKMSTTQKLITTAVSLAIVFICALIGLYQISYSFMCVAVILTIEFTHTKECEYFDGTTETFVITYALIKDMWTRAIVIGFFNTIGLVSFIYHW